MEVSIGLEPMTFAFAGRCSIPTELRNHGARRGIRTPIYIQLPFSRFEDEGVMRALIFTKDSSQNKYSNPKEQNQNPKSKSNDKGQEYPKPSNGNIT
jgi:hypothetical protein